MPAKLDLTGATYGQLTVLGPAENIDGKTAWRCRCSCGKLIVAKTYHLRRGAVRSCGCMVPARGNVDRLSYVDGTCLEMIQAGTVRRNNKSGCPGVYWDKATQSWRVQIGFKGVHYTLGRFPLEEKTQAIAMRKMAERLMYGNFLQWYRRNVEQKMK